MKIIRQLGFSFASSISKFPHFLKEEKECRQSLKDILNRVFFSQACNKQVIRMTGKFWKLDNKGYLINDASWSKIQPEYMETINTIKNIYVSHLGTALHSCYLTGSMSRGRLVPGLSDIDAFAVLKKRKDGPPMDIPQLEKGKILKNHSYFTDIQLETWRWEELFTFPRNRLTEYHVILKLNSLCLFGDDLSHLINPIKPSVALARTEVENFQADVEEALEAVSINPCAENVQFWCKRILKNLIRVGFYLTIPIEKKFTRDLDISVNTFLKYFPQQTEMVNCLDLLESPFTEPKSLKSYFEIGFGRWMLQESQNWLNKYPKTSKDTENGR